MQTSYQTIWRRRLIEILRLSFICLLLSISQRLIAQTPENVTPLPLGILDSQSCFNPSIAAYKNASSLKFLCVAYTYIDTSSTPQRKVAVSRSTDEGSTWTTVNLALPQWGGLSSGDALEHMDDAQILHVGGDRLVLVVRAWDGDDSTMFGDPWQEQDASVFKKSGIYICTSTNNGATWGHFSTGTTYTANIWHVVDENRGFDTNRITLEYPRITFRKGFGEVTYPLHFEMTYDQDPYENDEYGYIVWTKKEYTTGASFTVDSTEIGKKRFIAYIKGGGLGSFGNSIGTVPTQVTPYVSFSASTGYAGAERASVAMSHDGGVWLGFYESKYVASNDVLANFYIKKDNGTLVKIDSNVILPGEYISTMGAIYDPFGFPATPTPRLDIAQGPSIEVASIEPHLNCNTSIKYQIGYAYTYCDDRTTSKRFIKVRIAECNWGGSANSLIFDEPAVENQNADSKMRYLPTFTYAEATDSTHLFKTMEGVSSGFQPSYLVLGYLAAELNISNKLDDATCKAVISFNGSTFNDEQFTSTLRLADTENDDSPISFKLGSRMDIAACAGDLSIYPAWRRVHSTSSTDDGRIVTNAGGAYIVKPYLLGYPANSLDAYPNAFSVDIFAENTGSTIWNNYHYFHFDSASSRPILAGIASYTTDQSVGKWVRETTPSFIQPNTFASSYGLYYGIYKPQTTKQGFLNFSDQRKVVTVGNVAFAVCERDDTVFLTQSRGHTAFDPFLQEGLAPDMSLNFRQLDWTETVPVDTGDVIQSNPSIGVYQQGEGRSYLETGDGNGCTGQAAIAVTWVEKSPSDCDTLEGTLVKIKMKSREFDVCTGKWNGWSPIYTIHSHFHKDPSLPGELPDNTIPVIAPIVTPMRFPGDTINAPFSDMINPAAGVPTFLLGWTITWTGPKIIPMPANDCPEFAETRSEDTTDDENLYSRNWMRRNWVPPYGQLDSNQIWGSFVTPAQQVLVPSGATPYNDLLNNGFVTFDPYPSTPGSNTHSVTFPTITSSENKWRWWDNADNYRHEIAFSTSGEVFCGIWHTAAKYNRTGSGAGWGALIGQSSIVNLSAENFGTNRERNPCITINSSGQVFVAWEARERISGTWHDQIKVRTTDITDVSIWQPGAAIFDNVDTTNTGATPFDWNMLNPSITGFPKTRTLNWICPDSSFDDLYSDRDFGCVELLFGYREPVNVDADWDIRPRHYFEDRRLLDNECSALTAPEGRPAPEYIPSNSYPDGDTDGDWPTSRTAITGHDADQYTQNERSNAQKSHSPRQHSPYFRPSGVNDWDTTSAPDPYRQFEAWNTNPTSALELTNEHPDGGVTQPKFWNYRYDAYKLTPKKGWRDDKHYRCENLSDGMFSAETFIGNAERTDRFGNSSPIRMGYAYAPRGASYEETRDSVLHTSRFTWKSGDEVAYDRFISIATNEAAKIPVTTIFKQTYVVEVVRPNGQIHMIDRIFADAANGSASAAKRARIVNLGEDLENVYLRLRKIPDGSDSRLKKDLRMIFNESGTIAYEDTILAPLQLQMSLTIGKELIKVGGVFPNPATLTSQMVTAVVFAANGYEISAELVDQLGRQIAPVQTMNSTGNWMKISFAVPQTDGAYFIRLRSGEELKTLPLRVTK